MSLDVLTPLGQMSLEQEDRAVEIWAAHETELKYVPTPKNGAATVDAVLVSPTGKLRGVVETKCRDASLEKLRSKEKGWGYSNEWMVTWGKVEASRFIAHQLGVSLYGFCYLVPDDTLLVVKISDRTGRLLVPVRIEASYTQATINGGTALRNNGYIGMEDAEVLRL